MSAENSKIYILTPVHNRVGTTLEFVRRLKNQSYRNFRLVLIDDGSADGTAAKVLDELPDTAVIEGDGKLWWAGSLQQAYMWLQSITIADDDVVLIINDDTVFEGDYLESGLKSLRENGHALLISECNSLETGENFDRGVFFDDARFTFRPARDSSEINCASTRGLFLYASDFLGLGGFHPKLLPHYLSDYEFTARASKRGYRIYCDPGVRVKTSTVASGIDSLNQGGIWSSLKTMLFSKLYRRNVIFSSVFVLMRCRWYCVPGILLRVWAEETRRFSRLLPGPAYGVLRLILLPVYHLVRGLKIYLKTVFVETVSSLKIIAGKKRDP